MSDSNSDEKNNEMMVSLGVRTRTLRKSRKLTLETLSKKSGVSRASLSKIERGEMSPTYETLRKLANGLGVALTRLVMEIEELPEEDIQIVRAGEGKQYGNPLYKYELLSGSPDVFGETIYISEIATAEIGAFPEKHSHDSLDFFYVLEGEILAYFKGKEEFRLKAGDSLIFDGRRPHAFVKVDQRTNNPKVLWVSRPRD